MLIDVGDVVVYCFGCCCWFVVSLFEFLAFTSSSSSLPAAAPAAKGGFGCAAAALRRGARVMSFMVI